MSKVETVKGQPIYWFDGKTPKRTITDDDGIPRTVKMTAKPFRHFINGAGTVYQLGLSGAAADRNVHSAYAVQIVRRKLNAGHVPADECPVATGRLPANLRREGDEPCNGYLTRDGMPIQQPKLAPCPHAQRIIDARTKAHNAKEAKNAKAYENPNSAAQREMLDLMMRREQREAAGAAPPAPAPAPGAPAEGKKR